MRINIFKFFLLILSIGFYGIVHGLNSGQQARKVCSNLSVEGGAAYFYSTNSEFQKVYHGAPRYFIAVDVPAWGDWLITFDVDYIYGSGKSSQGNRTHIHVIPMGLSVARLFPFGNFLPYLQAAPLFAFSKITNHSRYIASNQTGWGGGGRARIGLYVDITDRFLLNFFADYSLISINYHSSKHILNPLPGDLNGFGFGGSFGYKF